MMNEVENNKPPTPAPEPNLEAELGLTAEDIEFTFTILKADRERMRKYTELAFELKLIPKNDLQHYLRLCLNAGAGYVEQRAGGK